MKEIAKAYDQSKEQDIYELWEASGYFNPNNLSGKPFTIMMPPPNATGTLHIGHAFEYSIQDILIRFHRMKGEKTLWLPGTDHAAIATNTKVEKILIKEEGKNRHDIGREAFVKKVEEFVEASRGIIQKQIKSLGASADWSREAFTLDEPRNLAVRTAFKRMFDAGLIYRGIRVINWDPKGQTAVSDDEVVHKPEQGHLYTFKYSKDFPIAIATTRPETKVGDVAVAVNLKDKRYKEYVGKEYDIEFAGAKLKIKIIADETIDPDFGTGAVGVTPAHSIADYEISQRHNLAAIQIITEYGRMTETAGSLVVGKKTKEAREIILGWLNEQGLLEKTETIDQNISTAERSGGIIEPLPKLQWFVDVNKRFEIKDSRLKKIKSRQKASLKELMQSVVKSGEIKILPGRFKKIYFHWINNLRDWNISRQLWYGHRIPVWYRKIETDKKMGFAGDIVAQVFDTKTRTYRLRDHGLSIGDEVAFEDSSNGNIFGYGTITEIKQTTVAEINLKDKKHWKTYKKHEDLIKAFKRHHPEKEVIDTTPVWIYTYEFKNAQYCAVEAPKEESWEQDPDTLDTWFSSALWTFSTLGWPNKTSDLKTFHPTDIMAPGYEILFFWVARMILMSTFLLGEIPFKTVYLHGIVRDIEGKKFSKSLDNGIDPLEIIKQYGADALRMALVVGVGPGNDSKYAEMKVKGYRNFANKIWNASRFVLQNISDLPKDATLHTQDKKILQQLEGIISETTNKIEKLDIAHAAEDLYHYFWHTFADKIIEESKPQLADSKRRASVQLLLKTMLEMQLKLLHPFMPFVTETIWQQMYNDPKKPLMIQEWPH